MRLLNIWKIESPVLLQQACWFQDFRWFWLRKRAERRRESCRWCPLCARWRQLDLLDAPWRGIPGLRSERKQKLHITYNYLAHALSAYGECNVFTVSVLPSVQGGGGYEHILAYQREVCNRYSNCLFVFKMFLSVLLQYSIHITSSHMNHIMWKCQNDWRQFYRHSFDMFKIFPM